jgi:hypothetical protein
VGPSAFGGLGDGGPEKCCGKKIIDLAPRAVFGVSLEVCHDQ